MKNPKIILLILLIGALLVSGFQCKLFPQSKIVVNKVKPITLNYWRVNDGPDNFSDIILAFRKVYSHININYRQFRLEEYEMALLEAWAEDRGPDIFSVPNAWLGKYETKILPMPQEINVGRQVLTGTIKKDYKVILETKKIPTTREFKETYVDTVFQDVYRQNKLWGVPLTLDTLALYYNRDLLNSAKIVDPPKTWQEFVEDVRLTTIKDRTGDIIQSGVAMGTADNIPNSIDVLSLLMLQNETQMIAPSGIGTAMESSSLSDSNYYPGEEALRFYTDFANPTKETYSWNKKMPDALEIFVQGKSAFFIGDSTYLDIIRTSAPKLNFDIAKMPQIEGSIREINYANYWVEVAAKKTVYPNEAWNFLLFMSDPLNVKSYLNRAKHPTAHRALIKDQLEDIDLAPFVNEVLTARSWYLGKDYRATGVFFKQMINDVLDGRKSIKEAISFCAQQVNQTY